MKRLIVLLVLVVLMIQVKAQDSKMTIIFSLAWNPDGTMLAMGGIFGDQLM
jgi:hypothetical protein